MPPAPPTCEDGPRVHVFAHVHVALVDGVHHGVWEQHGRQAGDSGWMREYVTNSDMMLPYGRGALGWVAGGEGLGEKSHAAAQGWALAPRRCVAMLSYWTRALVPCHRSRARAPAGRRLLTLYRLGAWGRRQPRYGQGLRGQVDRERCKGSPSAHSTPAAHCSGTHAVGHASQGPCPFPTLLDRTPARSAPLLPALVAPWPGALHPPAGT